MASFKASARSLDQGVGAVLQALDEQGLADDTLVVLTTDHWVSSCARLAANLGFRAIVVSDGTATFYWPGPDGEHHSAEQMHRHELASLNGEFATVRRTNEVLAEIDGGGARWGCLQRWWRT